MSPPREPGSLAGRRVVVTGATGIAAATAQRAAAEGSSVFVISLVADECASLVKSLAGTEGGHGWAAADLTDEAQTVDAFGRAADLLGGIDGLVAVAGGSARRLGDSALHEMTLDAWRAAHVINGDPAFLAAKEAVRAMRDGGLGGSVVLTGSVLASHPSPGLFSTHGYAAAKASIEGLTRALAAQYARERIRVNAMVPGLVRTPMSARAAEDPEIVRYATGKQPLAGGMLAPEAVADAAVFLLGDDARAITGQMLLVDGGWSVSEGWRP
jgi:NAD(P)-dependent dehydrogenase (short-subunit alcohol dehydrogenase family)